MLRSALTTGEPEEGAASTASDARRVLYPAHIPKDIDKNHTHFVFVKSFACSVCGRPSEGGTGYCDEHQDEDTNQADEWNRRIWRDTMKVRAILSTLLHNLHYRQVTTRLCVLGRCYAGTPAR